VAALATVATIGIPVPAIPAGEFVAMRWAPGPRLTSGVQHFAAGLLIGVVALELLDPVVDGAPVPVILGVAAGTVAMLTVDIVSARITGRESGGTGLAVVVAIDLAIDGFLLGVAAGKDPRLGILLAAGLAVEDFFTTMSLAVSLKGIEECGRIRWIVTGVAAAMVAGGAAGWLVSSVVGRFGYHLVLAFGAVAVLFLVFEELMREAHKVRDTPGTTAVLFAGLLGFLLLHMLV
jgi:ZIP family zinc transporter